ncbi:hypothetical protein GTA08_BOTSDO10400 [Neofusicoccum parvum]|nr:hypothetical protein GTA08_BOTSDO10400 [Neofusicoccum parvum]
MVEHLEDFADKRENIDLAKLRSALKYAGTHPAPQEDESDAGNAKTEFPAGAVQPVAATTSIMSKMMSFDWLHGAPVDATECDAERLMRDVLLAFEKTPAYKEAFDSIGSPVLRQMIRNFLDGKPILEAFGTGGPLQYSWAKRPADAQRRSDLPVIYEDAADTKPMTIWCEPFSNWGQTVKTGPTVRFMPTTVLGVQNLVSFARQNGRRIRCAGHRHSWSPMFVNNGTDDILVSFVSRSQADDIPNRLSLEPSACNAGNELKTISLLAETTAAGQRLCRIGAAVTNEDFRR